MAKYFAGIRFTIDAENEAAAEEIQRAAASLVLGQYSAVVDSSADEPVELDEFGHAGWTVQTRRKQL